MSASPLRDQRLQFISLSLSAAVLLTVAPPCVAGDQEEIKKLFEAYAGKRDEKAGLRLRRLGDEAVPFLAEAIRKQEPHPREYIDVEGHHKVMGTWSQEAASLLFKIDTPKAVAEARKLAADDNSEVRFWGIWMLKLCRTERKENLSLLRSSSYPSREEQAARIRVEVEKWWKETREKGKPR